MADWMFAIGLVIFGLTCLEVTAAVGQAGYRAKDLRKRAAEARDDYRKRTFLALARTEPERSGPTGGWQGFRKFYIARKVAEAKDIYSLHLRPHDGKPVPLFVPGQHLTLQLAIPDEPRPVTRCYSVSDAPLPSGQYRITIKKLGPSPVDSATDRGLVSNYLHDAVPERATLNVRAPNGQFYLDFTDNRPVVFIAGGIGVTPIISMLKAAATFGQPSEIWLFHGVRNRLAHAFRQEVRQAARQHGNVRSIACYSKPTDKCLRGRDYHHHGHVTVEFVKSVLPHNRYVFYLCGPAGMMQALSRGLRAWGVAAADIRTEAFGATAAKAQPAEDVTQRAGSGQTLPITFTRSRMTVNWTPDCQVLLDLAEKNGINLYTGCRAGQCGTCMASLAEGKVRHLVEPGVPLAEGFCLPCVAVPESKLLLNI